MHTPFAWSVEQVAHNRLSGIRYAYERGREWYQLKELDEPHLAAVINSIRLAACDVRKMACNHDRWSLEADQRSTR